MAKKKNTPPGRQTRPGEGVAPKPKPGDPLPKNYNGPAGQVKGKKPTVGSQKTEPKGKKPNKTKPGKQPAAPAPTPTDPAAPAPTPTDPASPVPTDPTGTSPARYELERYVKMSGFPVSMVDQIYAAWGKTVDADSPVEDYIAIGVENPEFRARYPSIVNQWDRLQAGEMGVQLMSPTQVLEYEDAVRNAADDYGLSSWVSSPSQIAKLIDSDVSADEAIDRINQAGYAATVAPKQFREAFFKHYGLTEGNLVGFFLDPDKEEAEIKKAVAQGQIVASAMQHGFSNNWGIGERLFERGVTEQEAMSGFARAALTGGLGGGLGQTVSEDTRIDAEFNDAKATAEVTSAAAQRVGRFSTKGGAAESSKGVSGLGGASAT